METAPAPAPENSTRQWLVGLSLSPLAGIVIPFGNIIAPLIIWLIKKEGNAELDAAGKAALNFQISISIYALIASLLTLILIGFLLIVAVFIVWVYGIVMSAVKASNGETFKYPVTISFLK